MHICYPSSCDLILVFNEILDEMRRKESDYRFGIEMDGLGLKMLFSNWFLSLWSLEPLHTSLLAETIDNLAFNVKN